MNEEFIFGTRLDIIVKIVRVSHRGSMGSNKKESKVKYALKYTRSNGVTEMQLSYRTETSPLE